MNNTAAEEQRFYLTERRDAPQTPDFDGRGPRLCAVDDTFVASSGREYWRVRVEPHITAGDRNWQHVVLVNRLRASSIRNVFSGDVVYVHVLLLDDWQGLKDRDATGLGASQYWGEIVQDPEALPDTVPSTRS